MECEVFIFPDWSPPDDPARPCRLRPSDDNDDDANVMRLTASEVEWERIEGEKAREMEKLEEKGDVFLLELDKTTFWSGLESTPCP